MKPKMALNVLEMAGLVRPVATVPEVEFSFRHGLLQETAYRSLVKKEREKLHFEVGRAMENAFPQRKDELAALLGNHFLLGGDRPRALHYLRLAAEKARGRYANTEALEYYTTAIDLARQLGQSDNCADLHRERGVTHEIVGNFDAARDDYEQALALGRDLEQPFVIWRALLDLGMLWAAKDYERAGEYFREALGKARGIGDQEAVARSLNRLGNWHINRGDPDAAKRLHQEALETFERLQDQRGVAETLDLLGMSHMISSDMHSGVEYYNRAIEKLRAIDDKELLASALTARAMRGGRAQSETVVGLSIEPGQVLRELDEVLELTEELGWKAGESFGRWMRSFMLSAVGRLGEGERYAREGLALAEDIGHAQWTCGSSCALGRALLERMEFEAAREQAERATELAFETGSRHWIGTSSGMLALIAIEGGALERAEQVIDRVADPGQQMLGDRLVRMGAAELSLARGEYRAALDELDRLVESAPGFTGEEVIPRLFRGRGRAYLGLGELERAREQLQRVEQACLEDGTRPLLWRLYGDLCRLERLAGQQKAAEEHLQAGSALIAEIAETVPQAEARSRFVERARRQLENLAEPASTAPGAAGG